MRAIADASDPSDSAWVEARRSFLGASDVASVLGIGWGNPIEVWAEKTGLTPPKEQTLAMSIGHYLEGLAAREYKETQLAGTGCELDHDPTTYAHDEHPWLAMTPDRFVVRPVHAERIREGLMEAKWVGVHVADRWRHEDGTWCPPVYVRSQCQVQMAVSDLPWVDVVALIATKAEPLVYRVHRDDAEIDFIIDYCGRWWQRHVVEGHRPDDMLGRPDRIKRSLEEVFSKADGGAVRLPPEAPELVAQLKHARAFAKDARSDVERLENRLRAMLGDATDGFVDDNAKPLVTWREQTRAGHDLKPIIEGRTFELDCTQDELEVARRLLAACETVSRFRVLRVA